MSRPVPQPLKPSVGSYRRRFLFGSLFIVLILLLFTRESLGALVPEGNCRRMANYLLIGDRERALQEARTLPQAFPEEPAAYETALKGLSAYGDESEGIALWERFHMRFPEQALKQEVLEPICWGILRRGARAPGITAQVVSLVGAALTQDRYAVSFILNGLNHTNARIRALSVTFAALYGDQPLYEKIEQLFYTESVLEVRVELIQAIVKLHMDHLIPELLRRVTDTTLSAKEKGAALRAIVAFRDTIAHEELTLLVSSPRAALRELACHYVAEYGLKEEQPVLERLMRDTHPDVQVAALRAWGQLRLPPNEAIQREAQRARDPRVGIAAGWVWLLSEPEKGEGALGHWLCHAQEAVRVLAAAAVGNAGPYGVALASTYLDQSEDPYVRANLALALIGQRQDCAKACAVLEHFLQTHSEKILLEEEGPFPMLTKGHVAADPAIPNYPEWVNQTARLEILNLLAMVDYPGAEAAMKVFLQQRHWGVTGLAAEALLGEGDEKAVACITALLQDHDAHIRIEAALVLATWGRDERALAPLLEAYPSADRALQIKILESLGRIGHRSAIPFLLERLKEPSLVMRTIAASILLQTLNA